ncbi:hypothetical protein ACWATR_15010 [Nostoc sp. UIC 10890]
MSRFSPVWKLFFTHRLIRENHRYEIDNWGSSKNLWILRRQLSKLIGCGNTVASFSIVTVL